MLPGNKYCCLTDDVCSVSLQLYIAVCILPFTSLDNRFAIPGELAFCCLPQNIFCLVYYATINQSISQKLFVMRAVLCTELESEAQAVASGRVLRIVIEKVGLEASFESI